MWSPPPSQGSFATCSVEWSGQAAASTLEVSDTSVSPTFPAHLNTTPPRNSLASFWQTAGAAVDQLFTIVAPAGSIVDVHLSLILSDDDATAVTLAIATGVLGNQYYLALDCTAGHNFPPVSLTTTF
jgi:hypothetical protein